MASLWSKSLPDRKRKLVMSAGMGFATLTATAVQLPFNAPLKALAQSFLYSRDWVWFLATNKFYSFDVFETFSVRAVGPAATVAFGGFLTVFSTLTAIAALTRQIEYGDVEWATPANISDQELDGKDGPVYGVLDGEILRPTANRHCITVTPNRGGKTSGIIIPSILDDPHTCVSISTRGELVDKCGPAERAKGKLVIDLDFASPNSANHWSFCALSILPTESHLLERQAARDAAMFIPMEDGKDPHWPKTGRKYASALLHFEYLEAQREQRDGNIAGLLSRIRRAFLDGKKLEKTAKKGQPAKDPFGDELMRIALEADHWGYPPRISESLAEFAVMDYKERSTHWGTISTSFDVLTYETVQRTLSKTDFSFEQLRTQPCSVFIRFPQSDKEAFGALTALFFDNLISYCLDHYPDSRSSPYKVPVRLNFDEFSSLPKIPNLAALATTGAGNAITYNIVLQSIVSLRKVYGDEASVILDNATYLLSMGSPDPETQKYLSGLIGDQTRAKKTSSGSSMSPVSSTLTQASEAARLVKPEWWGNIPLGNLVVLTQRHYDRPIYAKTAFWFENERWKRQVPVEFHNMKA